MEIFWQKIGSFFSNLFIIANDEAGRIRNAFMITVVGAIIIYVNQLIFDSTTWTILIAFVCDVIIIWAWFNVRRIAVMFGLGEAAEIIGVITPQKPTNALFDLYLYVSLYIIFWIHVLCFFIPLISLRENPLFGLFFLFGGTIYIIMYPDGKFFRKSLAWGAVFILILMSLQMISLTGWVKLGWMEPYWTLRMSDEDRALAEVLKADEKDTDKKMAIRLRTIAEKRKKGGNLTDKEKEFLEERKRGGLIQKAIGGIFAPSADTKSPSPIAIAPKKTGERASRVPLIGGKSEIRKGEYAEFKFDNSPGRDISRYQIVFRIEGDIPTRHYLTIDGWPETFDYRQNKSGSVIFFDKFGSGRIGESKFFHPGKVKVQLWSDSDIKVLSSHVELIYPG